MASSSSVSSLPSPARFSPPSVARRLGVPPSRRSSIHLLVGGWSSSMALLLHGLLPPSLHLAIAGAFSLSLGLPPLSAVLRFSVLSASSVVESFSLSPCLVAPWGFLLFAWAPGGFVQCSLLSLCRVASALLSPFCNSSSYGLHPDVSMSAFPGYCLFRSSVLLFLSFCMGAWSPCLVSLLCVSFLGFHSSLFPSGRLFLSFFRRSSDSVESPLHYATGSPFGPSQLLVSLLAFHCGSHSSWVSSPFGEPSRYTSVLRWGFLPFDFLLGYFPFAWAPTCCFLCMLSVPSVCPPLAPILALAQVSHYFSVFSLLVTRSNLSSFATGSSLRAESLLSGFSCILSHASLLVHFS